MITTVFIQANLIRDLVSKYVSHFPLLSYLWFVIVAGSPALGGSSPSPLGYQPSPSPSGGYSYSPMTPGAPFTPQTPGTAMDHFQADWHTPEIEVRIRETHDDADLIHQTGVIRGVTVSTVKYLNLEKLIF